MNLPFLYRMAISFVFLSGIMILIGYQDNKFGRDLKAIDIKKDLWKVIHRDLISFNNLF